MLVVDDNSPDGTGRLADELAAAESRISVLHRDGSTEDFTDAGAVMLAWRRVNEAAGLDGRVHLDLLFHPRART